MISPPRPPTTTALATPLLVRTDVAPPPPRAGTDRLRWLRVDDLPVTIATGRAMLRRTARRERIAIRTFRHPPTCDEASGLTGQLLYALWINQPRGPTHDARHSLSLPTHGRMGSPIRIRVADLSNSTPITAASFSQPCRRGFPNGQGCCRCFGLAPARHNSISPGVVSCAW
jgi:hypothetical protein